MIRDIEKWLWQCLRQHQLRLFCSLPNRRTLSQRFDQRHAQRPNIRSRQHASTASDLGCGISTGRAQDPARLARSTKPVTRDFDQIAHRHHVCGLDMTVHEAFSVNVSQRIEKGNERVAGLRRGEGPIRKNLRKTLLCVFGYRVKQLLAIESATTSLKESKQMRMRQFRSEFPPGKLKFRVLSIGQNKLDRHLVGFAVSPLGQKHGTTLRAAQISEQLELLIDDWPSHFSQASAILLHL